MAEDQEYEVKSKKKAKGPGAAAKAIVGAGVLGMVGLLAYPLIAPDSKAPLETSGSLEFQEGSPDNSFARIQPGEAEPEPSFDFSGVDAQLEEQRRAMAERERALQEQVRQLEAQLRGISDNAGAGQQELAEQISAAVTAANEENARILREMQAAMNQQIEGLQARLSEAEQQNVSAEMARLEAERLAAERMSQDAEAQRLAEQQAAAERERRAELERIRQEQRAIMAARIKSPSVIYDERASSGSTDQSTGQSSPTSRNLTSDERNRAFVESGASPVEVTSAEVIANPSKTVVQGTMIAATLENAIDSSLPGAVTAMVNEPVYSFDGSGVLIPSGSKVFGQYSSDISLGQGRILVRWSRLVTPEGQSVQIAAYGGDQQGRSGVTGHVNSRFGMRFGGAALVSLIGAAPSIAANAYASDNELARDTAEDIGDDLANASADVINEYATLPPIITVEQGARVTIMVDRDLEFY
jgi:type IV secretion system protein VirB10